jgi:hypothetical protein
MRRIMRPSADDAGQPAPGGEAAAPDATAPIGEPNPGANPFARPTGEPAEGQEQPTAAAQPADAATEAERAAGEAEGAAGATGEPTAAEQPPAAAEQPTQVLPAADPQAADPLAADPQPADGEQPPADATAAIPAVPAAPKRRLFRRKLQPVLPAGSAVPVADPAAEAPPVAEAAVVLPEPEGPAGLDPADAAMRPPAGRRGRLRRRLRYLRRARELMLRDLGGLVFEIHRTGGGDMASHAPIVAGKVDRLRQLDAESVALESALDTPRGEAVVFQPGVGGTCVVCGELYASTAKFCSECGTSTAAVPEQPAPASPIVGAPVVEPGGSLGFAKAGPAAFTSGDPLAQRHAADPQPEAAEPPAEPAEAPTAGESEPAAAAEPAEPASEPGAAEPAEPAPRAGAAEPAPARTEPERNGVVPPTLSPGDPLATRDRS